MQESLRTYQIQQQADVLLLCPASDNIVAVFSARVLAVS